MKALPFGYMESVVFKQVTLLNNLNGGFTMGLYGLVGEPGADVGVSIVVDGMRISGSTGANKSLPHSGVGMQLSNYPTGYKPGRLAHGAIMMRDVHISNCSASGIDIENWSRDTIALQFDNLTIGGDVATENEYWPGHPTSGPPVPIALAPYDDTPAHKVGGVWFGPRPAVIDMSAAAMTARPRPWLSVTAEGSAASMCNVGGNAVVITRNASTCKALTGHASENVTVSVDCRVL